MTGCEPDAAVRVAVSRCLLGDRVRYDGAAKYAGSVADVLSRHVELVPICPEVEAGLGVPREPMHLEGDARALSVVGSSTRRDFTAALQSSAERLQADLEARGIDGFVLKSKSPSCGLAGIPVYAPGAAGEGGRGDAATAPARGQGVFARGAAAAYPAAVCADENEIAEPALRAQFSRAIHSHRRWRTLLGARPTRWALESFHARHRYVLLSRHPGRAHELGRLVAGAPAASIVDLADSYRRGFFELLRIAPSRSAQVNALEHMAGYLRGGASESERERVGGAIDRFKRGEGTEGEALACLRAAAKARGIRDLLEDVYLFPEPGERPLSEGGA